MLNLNKIENEKSSPMTKDEVMRHIVAAGINSLVSSDSLNKDDLAYFSKESFFKFLDCWDLLSRQSKFFFFESQLDNFKDFLKTKAL